LSTLAEGPGRRFQRLEDWLRWQETLHPQAIDLGLDRLRVVAAGLGLKRPAPAVVTVGGTNGKGSCVALLDAMLSAAGMQVGCYTSPHLLRYNERLRIRGREVSDQDLCAAFQRIDQARGAITLTYFEFGTLAALDLLQGAELDVALLEVGLGGRLDAVNLVDADVSLVVTVALDHLDWLGPDRDSIGREKAGIFRRGRPAVVADPAPPVGLLAAAGEIGTRLLTRGRDFELRRRGDGRWDWLGPSSELCALPPPALAGSWQLDNAAAVLTALHCGPPQLALERAAIEAGLRQVRLSGRLQRLPGPVPVIVDVAHNPQAVAALAGALAADPVAGRTHAVLAMLADKDSRMALTAMAPQVDAWYLATLSGPRGQSGEALAAQLQALGDRRPRRCFTDVASAEDAALAAATGADRVVVFGSFLTAAAALERSAQQPAAALTATGI